MTICSIVKADGKTFRKIHKDIYERFHDLSACYFDWKIVKDWKLNK